MALEKAGKLREFFSLLLYGHPGRCFCVCQLQKCSQTFTDLDHKYHTLAQSLFDADPTTFANIQG